MPRREPDAWRVAAQAAFASALAVVTALVLVGMGGDRTATGTGPRVVEASAGPLATVARATSTSIAADVAPPAQAPPAVAGTEIVAGAAANHGPGTQQDVEDRTSPAADVVPALVAAPSQGPAAGFSAPPTVPTTTPSTTVTTTSSTTTTTTVAVAAARSRSPGAESEIVPLTNRDRGAQGLPPLARNGCLDAVASRLAERMATSGVLAHDPGAGAGVTGCRPDAAWGDNVGTAGPCSPKLLEERWMASPGHRRNILNGDFRHIGVGAWTDASGSCWVQVLFSS